VATTTYSDPELQRLRAPARDAADLTKVLADPGIGGFTVTSVINKPARAILLAIEDFLADRGTGDLLLVYLSCHGVLDDRRRLFFAAKDTRKDRLGATGVESAWVRDQLEHCRARSQIVILDSCFSGAFGKGEGKGDDGLDLKGRLKGNGHGRIVLTASDATESAHEAEAAETGSVFTSALVAGLRSGAADIDHDGRITVDEAYAYTFDRVQAAGAAQTPQFWAYGAEGKIVLARSPAGRILDRPQLLESVRAALDSPLPGIRIAAVGELGAWLDSGDPARELVAREQLREVADRDSPQVAAAARRLLGADRAAGVTQDAAAGAGTARSEAKTGQAKTAASPGTAQERERSRRATPGKAAPGSGAVLPPQRKPGPRPLRSEKAPATGQKAPASGSGAALAPERKPGTGPPRSAAGQRAPAAGRKAPASGQKAVRPARLPTPGPGAAQHPHVPLVHLPAFTVPARRINTLAFSPDGKMLATAADTADGAVLLWDPLTGQRLRALKIGTESTVDAGLPFYLSNYWIAFSPDGRRLASGGPIFNRVWLWDPATGRSQREITLPSHATTAGFSPDGRQLAVANTNGTVCWYDAATGQQRGLVRLVRPRGKAIEAVKRAVSGGRTQAPYSSMMFSPGLRALAGTSGDGSVRVWNPATGQQRGAFQLQPGSPTTVAARTIPPSAPTILGFSPDGNLLAVVDAQLPGGVELRDVATGLLRHRVGGFTVGGAFSPDGSMLATCQLGSVLLSDVATGKQLHVLAAEGLSGTGRSINCMAFGPRGDMLAAAESSPTFELLKPVTHGDASVRVWL
jgi:WD40 repeat protein